MRPRPNVSALSRAVAASETWRGSITGDDDAEDAFNAEIAKQRKALRDLRKLLAYHDALLVFVRQVASLGAYSRDEKRNEQLLTSMIKRAQILYP